MLVFQRLFLKLIDIIYSVIGYIWNPGSKSSHRLPLEWSSLHVRSGISCRRSLGEFEAKILWSMSQDHSPFSANDPEFGCNLIFMKKCFIERKNIFIYSSQEPIIFKGKVKGILTEISVKCKQMVLAHSLWSLLM